MTIEAPVTDIWLAGPKMMPHKLSFPATTASMVFAVDRRKDNDSSAAMALVDASATTKAIDEPTTLFQFKRMTSPESAHYLEYRLLTAAVIPPVFMTPPPRFSTVPWSANGGALYTRLVDDRSPRFTFLKAFAVPMRSRSVRAGARCRLSLETAVSRRYRSRTIPIGEIAMRRARVRTLQRWPVAVVAGLWSTFAFSQTASNPIPVTLTVAGGGAQNVVVRTQAPTPFSVRATDPSGAPIAGLTVGFGANLCGEFEAGACPPSSLYGTFGGVDGAYVTTDANGVAVAPEFIAGDLIGSYDELALVADQEVGGIFYTHSPGLGYFAYFHLVQVSRIGIRPAEGLWWNNHGGSGLTVDTQGSTLSIGVYAYDSKGDPTWYLAAGAYDATTGTFTGAANTFAGGQCLGCDYTDPTASPAGNFSITFTDAEHGTLTFPGGSYAIQHFVYGYASKRDYLMGEWVFSLLVPPVAGVAQGRSQWIVFDTPVGSNSIVGHDESGTEQATATYDDFSDTFTVDVVGYPGSGHDGPPSQETPIQYRLQGDDRVLSGTGVTVSNAPVNGPYPAFAARLSSSAVVPPSNSSNDN